MRRWERRREETSARQTTERRQRAAEAGEAERGWTLVDDEAGGDEAADVTFQFDVTESGFAGTDLARFLFGKIPEFQEFLVSEQRVAVKSDLGIQSNHLIVPGDDQGIDLGKGAIVVNKESADRRHEAGGSLRSSVLFRLLRSLGHLGSARLLRSLGLHVSL